MRKIATLSALLAFGAGSLSFAQELDCTATDLGETQQAICASPMLMGFENAFQNLQSTLATFGGEPFDATALTTALDACGTEEICISTAYVEQIGVLSDEIAEAGQARASEPSLADVLARLEALEGASEVAEVVEAEEPAEAVVAEEAEPAGVIEAEEIVVTEPTEEAQPRFLRGLDYRVYATTMTHPDRGGRYIQDSWLDPPSNVATVTDALQGIQVFEGVALEGDPFWLNEHSEDTMHTRFYEQVVAWEWEGFVNLGEAGDKLLTMQQAMGWHFVRCDGEMQINGDRVFSLYYRRGGNYEPQIPVEVVTDNGLLPFYAFISCTIRNQSPVATLTRDERELVRPSLELIDLARGEVRELQISDFFRSNPDFEE